MIIVIHMGIIMQINSYGHVIIVYKLMNLNIEHRVISY